MRGWRPLALTLACLLGASATAMAGPQATAAPNAATTAETRNQALASFQTDLVSVLAPSADPQRLLAAALLARPLSGQSKIVTFHALIARAAQADGAGPAITWARLADCNPNTTGDCPNSSAVTQLTQQAPDNAAVWLLKLSQDVSALKKDAVREDLTKAASAKLYDDYSGIGLQALANVVSILPPPTTTVDPNSAAGAEGVQILIVFGNAAGMPQPALRDTAVYCEKNAANDASIKDDCLKLGKLLEWGSSPLARSLGLHLREALMRPSSKMPRTPGAT
jgi:hypothetical protein